MLSNQKELNDLIGDQSDLDEQLRNRLGQQIAVDMHSFLLLTETADRFYSKPRGYAGDFMTIEMIYRNQPDGLVFEIEQKPSNDFIDH